MKLIKLITILAFVFIVGCDAAAPTPTTKATTEGAASTQAATQDSSSYPYPAANNEPTSAYPAGEPQVEMPPTPTTDASLGIVKGVLLLQGKPVANADMYLAGIILDNSGKDVAAVLDRPTSPRTRTDAQGNFTFVNIKSGSYGIVIDTVLESYVLLQPGSEDQIRLTVTAGQTTDLGELNFDDLPVK